jgi:hypothetical protein
VAVMVAQDLGAIQSASVFDRARAGQLTSLELLVAWAALGAIVYVMTPRRALHHGIEPRSVADEPGS